MARLLQAGAAVLRYLVTPGELAVAADAAAGVLDLRAPDDLAFLQYTSGSVFVIYFYQDLLAISYDEEFARIRGVPIRALYFGLIGMLAVTIVMVIQVVGLILVIALLTIPPFIVEKYAKSLFQMMMGSSLLGVVLR